MLAEVICNLRVLGIFCSVAWSVHLSSGMVLVRRNLEADASWLHSYAASVQKASYANSFPFSPTAICHFWLEVGCSLHGLGV